MSYRNDGDAELRRENERLTAELAAADRRVAAAEAQASAARALGRFDRIKDVAGVGWRIGAVVSVVGFLFTGFVLGVQNCERSPAPVTRGIITDRYDDPSYTTPGYTTQLCSGPPMRCIPVYHPPVFHPEVWSIRVAHNGDQRVVELPEEAWAATAVGHSWCESPTDPCDLNTVERSR